MGETYNQENLKGLETRLAPGKEKLLTAEERERLLKRLLAGPRSEDKTCAFRGEDIRRILKEEFGKVRSLSAVYYLLHSLGYALLVPRPKHQKTEVEEQEMFKKNSRRSRPDSGKASFTKSRSLV